MPVYQTTEQLDQAIQALFNQIGQDPQAAKSLTDSRLIIRLRISAPALDVVINGRTNPPKVTYGNTTLRPDLDISVSADSLHQVMLGTLPLGKAVSSGALKVNGSILKSFVLADIFHSGQRFYPDILKSMGIPA
jgi:hypothetical protein